MLSVFMDCGADDQRLATTLATLVPGAVEGVVREVVLVDRGMGPDAWTVADHAGCRVVAPDEFRHAIVGARGDWLLFLEPGARLLPGWMEAVIGHAEAAALGRGVLEPARFRRARGDRPGLLGRLRQIRTALAEGFLVRKTQGIGLARLAFSLEEAAKGVAVERLTAEIRPAPRAG